MKLVRRPARPQLLRLRLALRSPATMRPSQIRLALPRPPSEAQRRAKSSMGESAAPPRPTPAEPFERELMSLPCAGATIGSFLAVLSGVSSLALRSSPSEASQADPRPPLLADAVGIGGFFVMKHRNVEKAKAQYADRRIKTGALSQMQGGASLPLVLPSAQLPARTQADEYLLLRSQARRSSETQPSRAAAEGRERERGRSRASERFLYILCSLTHAAPFRTLQSSARDEQQIQYLQPRRASYALELLLLFALLRLGIALRAPASLVQPARVHGLTSARASRPSAREGSLRERRTEPRTPTAHLALAPILAPPTPLSPARGASRTRERMSTGAGATSTRNGGRRLRGSRSGRARQLAVGES